jgi:hypothetical protein
MRSFETLIQLNLQSIFDLLTAAPETMEGLIESMRTLTKDSPAEIADGIAGFLEQFCSLSRTCVAWQF